LPINPWGVDLDNVDNASVKHIPALSKSQNWGLTKTKYVYILLFINVSIQSDYKPLQNTMNCAAMRMRRATRKITDYYNAIMAPSGLHANQFMLLVPLYLQPELTINELAQAAELDRTTLTRNLKVLEERQLITLSPGEDQRQRLIRLTIHGEQMVKIALPLWEQAQQQLVAQLGSSHLPQLFAYLDKIEKIATT